MVQVDANANEKTEQSFGHGIEFVIPNDYQNYIVFTDGTTILFTIAADGKIIRGPGFTTDDEMSLKFWKLIEETAPNLKCFGHRTDEDADKDRA